MRTGLSNPLFRPVSWRVVLVLGPILSALGLGALWKLSDNAADPLAHDTPWQGAAYLKSDGDQEYLLASRKGDETEWFDITGLPLDKHRFQYGIGKDRIASIDDPVFVAPDDPRLLALSRESIDTTDELAVIGYAVDGVARAYPIGLLDHHELVNDTVAGKPVTVGW